MNEQITSAAELDALPVGWAGIGVDGNIWQRVDARVEWQSLTGGGYTYASDFIRECAPLATIHRPDQPQRVQPSREDVAETLFLHQYPDSGGWDGPGWEIRRRPWLEMAAAVLALFAQQPTVAEVARKAWARGYSDAMGDYEHSDPLPPNPYGESETRS